jgi:Velvet factor
MSKSKSFGVTTSPLKVISRTTTPFHVFQPQLYPGTLPTTKISRWFCLQGAKVRGGMHSRKEEKKQVSREDLELQMRTSILREKI